MSYTFIEGMDYDYDLTGAIEYNPDDAYQGAITNIFDYILGENGASDWHWLVSLDTGKFAYITGGCDYTGWGCQSSIRIKEFDNKEQIIVPLYDNDNRSPANEFKSAIDLINFIRGC